MEDSKSSYYPITFSDHRYRYFAHLQKIIYSLTPTSEEHKLTFNKLFLECKDFASINEVSFFSVDELGREDQIRKNFSSILEKLNPTEEETKDFEVLMKELINEEDFKELFTDYLEHELGIDNADEGGLFWVESFENGLHAIFAHIDDIVELETPERRDYLERIFSHLKNDFQPLEELVPSPTFNFGCLIRSEEDIEKLSDKEFSYTKALIRKETKRRYEKMKTKLIISYINTNKLEVLIPGIENKIEGFIAQSKAIYFLTLLYPDGLTFNDVDKDEIKEKLITIYSDIYFTKNSNREIINKLLDDKQKFSTKKTTASAVIKSHVEDHFEDRDHASLIIDDVSFTPEEYYLNIPVDRDAISGIKLIHKLFIRGYQIS